MQNDEARTNDETYTADLLRILKFGVISSFGLCHCAYALIAAMLGACASTAAPPGPPPNRFAAKYDPITSTAAMSCATRVSTVGKTANQSLIHPGMYGSRDAIGVVGIHRASCISCACSPTITSSTTPSRMPVVISIFRYGRRC